MQFYRALLNSPMATRQEFSVAFATYHSQNAAKYPHLLKLTAVSRSQLEEAERSIGVQLPVEFKDFLLEYGYGELYFAGIFCPLVAAPDRVLFTMWDYFNWEQFGGNYLPIWSNGDELWTGFRVHNNRCSNQLFNFDVDARDYTGDSFDSIWDFLLQVALVDLPPR